MTRTDLIAWFWRRQPRRAAGAVLRDSRGTSAIEFAVLGLPFTMMLFGTISVGLFYFTTFAMENAVEQAGRLIRTGQVQQSGMSAAQFKYEVCQRAPPYVDCDGKMCVNVQSYGTFKAITKPSCTDTGGNLIPAASTMFNTGAASEVVLVTVCYEWELAGQIPFLRLGTMSNGSALIQASTTFRTEPFDE